MVEHSQSDNADPPIFNGGPDLYVAGITCVMRPDLY